MGQEYFINSQELEDKIRKLLPSQGGAGAGFDLSASTQIIPIIDLTESASGSNLREDLQKSLSFDTATVFNVANTTSTIISNTGYWRIFGNSTTVSNTAGDETSEILINDGVSSKAIWKVNVDTLPVAIAILSFDFIVYLPAGHTLQMLSSNADQNLTGSVRQIADIDGNLINP